ncbi:uncharacterized protein LOC115443859 [Manduca sexta]|uniref:NACHT domain-containing protein n=1 Tax=Manduca sexta TaxID=7130 RepID=A0A921Z3E2_MANSE|nr:uncharacterized protein LOC115443859 [Manduca sexta]KAG6450629.1 hypothetical protein O3G_MSEX006691 [Manduca sexta]
MDLSINVQKKQLKFDNMIESQRASTDQSNESDSQLNPLSRNNDDARRIPCKVLKPPFLYTKRSGTAGIGGQLYETKLLSLFFLRALHHKDISEFNLATNIEGIGAFDDIVLKYETSNKETPKVLFIQAKHKEEPDQNKITIHDFFKEYGDFCLHKYFDSYLNIRSKFNRNKNDNIFKNAFKDVDCRFIIYTSAIENIQERDIIMEDNSAHYIPLLHTSNTGKVFRLAFNDNDVEGLLETVLDVRTQLLGKTLMKFLFKDNYKNMLVDDLMKTYHVFLAQQVITIISDAGLDNPFLEGKFRDTFLSSKQKVLKVLKQSIHKEFSLKYPKYCFDKIEKLITDFTFKLPLNFGNLNFYIGDSSRKSERKLVYICSKIKQLIDRADASLLIRIDDNMVGLGEILQPKDFEIYRLGGLVGNMFVVDDKTHRLKFNESMESLPPSVVRIFELLKTQYPPGFNFNKYRFQVNTSLFPKFFLGRDMHLWSLVREFLDNLVFCTNQACENDVEKVLKDEIPKYCELNLDTDNLRFRMKCTTIFLKVHDAIQKWWKQSNNVPYLDENCTFFNEAKEELFTNSLLNTFHFIYVTKLSMYDIKFNDEFLYFNENEQGFLNIVTNNIIFTSIKLIQCLPRNEKYSSQIFIHLDFVVSENCFDEMLTQLKEVKLKTIFVVCENNDLYQKINNILAIAQSFIVVITTNEIREQALSKIDSVEYNQIRDDKTAFIDLTTETQRKILNKTNVIFQGSMVPLKTLVKNNFNIIDTATLFAILNKDNIQIGKKITKVKYEEFENSYVQRTICRFITLEQKTNHTLYIINDADTKPIIPDGELDVILISDKKESFITYCETYVDKNIHWFIQQNDNCVWQMSRGSLHGIYEHVGKSSRQSFKYKPNTLFETDEKVIILSAEPGMGKSTFMTYLSIQTKLNYPSNWILRINCLDYKNIFSYWHENNTVIDLKDVMKLLYVASNLLVTKKKMAVNLADCFRYNLSVNVYPNGDVFIDTNDQEFFGLDYLEVELFNNMYNNGQVVVIIDGFDEISPDYLNEVMALLEILKKSKVSRLWVATRPYNIVNNLEQRLGTFAFSLEKLSINDQYDLFEKLWGKTVNEKSNDRLRFYTENFIKPISLVLYDHEKDFMSIPLHVYMIAEIYQDFFKDYYDVYIPKLSDDYMNKIKDINTLTLYERFVNIKFYYIHFGVKKPYIYDRDPVMKKMIEKERRDFIKTHKKLAAHTVLNKTVKSLFSMEDIREINDALEQVRQGEERIGIIDRVVGDEPQFVHLTFAEYFATEYLCDKLKAKECPVDVWIYLFDTIFITGEGIKLRMFFNLKLAADKELYKLCENVKYKQEIFHTLMKQREECSLSISLVEYAGTFAMFLLECIKDVLTKNNLGDFINHIIRRKRVSCTFCSIINGRFQNVLETVLSLIKQVDKSRLLELFTCGDVPLFNALGIAVTYSGAFPADKVLLDVMLTSVEDNDVALKLFTMPSNMGLLKNTIIHVLIMNRHSLGTLFKHLLRFNEKQRTIIFSTFDADGKLAAHFAAQQGDLEFFEMLDFLLGKDSFQMICMTYDNIGRTVFDYLLQSVRDTKILELEKPFKELYEYNKSENCVRYARVNK